MTITKKMIFCSACVVSLFGSVPHAKAGLKNTLEGVTGFCLIYGGARLFATFVLDQKLGYKVDLTALSLILASTGGYLMNDAVQKYTNEKISKVQKEKKKSPQKDQHLQYP